MAKLMAVLRTLFLVFVFLYALRELPLALLLSSDARQGDVMVPFTKVRAVSSVTWLAIAWIALEVVVGWSHVWVTGKLRARSEVRAARAAARAAEPAAPGPAGPAAPPGPPAPPAA
jgi:hypothetical protein